MRGRWKTVPNKNIRKLCIDVELWDSIEVDQLDLELTVDQLALACDLLLVNGIERYRFEKCKIIVEKAEVFEWEQITSKIESIVSAWRGEVLAISAAR